MLWIGVLVAVAAAVRGIWSPCGLSMLSSLNPVSERARGNRYSLTVGWYAFGGAVGGAVLGGGSAALALAVRAIGFSGDVRWGIAAAAACVAVASDLAPFGKHLPIHPRQVDERWLTAYRRWIYAGGYGVQIGLGFATYIMTAAVYLVVALAALTANPAAALLIGLAFGTVRGLALLVTVAARTPERLRRLIAAVDRSSATSLRVVTALEAGVAIVAGALAGGVPAAVTAGVVLLAVAGTGSTFGSRRGRVNRHGALRSQG